MAKRGNLGLIVARCVHATKSNIFPIKTRAIDVYQPKELELVMPGTEVPARARFIRLLPLHYLVEKQTALVFMGDPYHWRDLAVVSWASKAKAIQYKTVVHRLKLSIVVDIKSPRGKYSVHSFIHDLLDVLMAPAYGGVECFGAISVLSCKCRTQ